MLVEAGTSKLVKTTMMMECLWMMAGPFPAWV